VAGDTDVVVVGCGANGLTTAIMLREAGFSVEIWTEQPAERSTSIVAGATWFPYKASPFDRVLEWATRSRPFFDELAAGATGGVTIRECVHLWRHPVGEPWWADAVPDLHRCPDDRLLPGFRDSYVFRQPVADMPIYLNYLTERFLGAGGAITQRRLSSLAEAEPHAAVVVNCTGLGARELVGDEDLVPVRGQWVRVANPGIDRVMADFDNPDGEAYVIPRTDSCILGGTADEGAWDTEPDMDTARNLIARCATLDARLADAPILEHRAGLRPVRKSGVRLEVTEGGRLIHNYGHGGAGVTLSWGCAQEVRDLLHAARTR
jgi:D-amino-acid oxidase